VLRGGEHLLRLIDDVLDLSRIEAGGIAVSCEAVDPLAVIDEVMAALEPLATRSGITVCRPRVDGSIPAVVADRTRLVQILMNFGSNAIKYGRPGGAVELAICASGGRVRISVIDDGIGIPADKQAIIFEPFQRAGQETGPIEGTGIGLTIAQRLALLMHGRVGFDSAADVGSTFWVEVPQCARERDDAGAPLPRPPGAALACGDHTVIYIEDNPANIAFMRSLLDELTNVKLITAPAAELGLELVRAHLPDLVILDINLPGMSGFEAMRQLERWPETRAIPVVALSAAALAKDTARAAGAGFYRYLTKPVKVGELLAVLEDVLVRRAPATRSTTSTSESAEKSR
jgi:CheY-like chemotaxis protein